ncbi:hypothetical protein PILCRDRAFT_14268 [Piloderma croceum F 1598]|uniref:Uncharacterized protein n=1 Tax=Piloderma croceum (strain F 1598) TaxID=765440 RepID=A0A0C3AL54_PILCF|nr:hypothetical protein PILCRDRAFT_14268 [Piloderma croceum F 1598]
MSSGYTPLDDQTSTREQQNPISSIPRTDSPMAPRPSAISHKGPSPFVSATSHIPLEGPIKRALRTRTPPEGSDHEEVSPSPHREADPVQLLLKGDNILVAISKAFERPPAHGGPSLVGLPVEGQLPYGQSYEDNYPPEESTGNPSIPTNVVGEDSTGSRQSGHNNNEILQDTLPSSEGNDPQDHGMPIYNPSSPVRGILEREFTSRRADETNSQYENQYLAHQRRINNTQQLWARSGYESTLH